MGRFNSTVEFYTRYREPYLPNFFESVTEKIGVHGDERLLDVGCGPGPLAIGFAPYVWSCVGIDPEPAMIAAAKDAADHSHVALKLVHGRIEDFSSDEKFDVVTIGRALHWMDREATLGVLERITADGGRILICGASSVESEISPWVKPYDEVRRRWASGPSEKQYRLDGAAWFSGSRFCEVEAVSVRDVIEVTVEELIGRALSKSNTSPEVLGEHRAEFEDEIRAVLEPFAKQGTLHDQIKARASIFARRE